jgi:hypothetical protein
LELVSGPALVLASALALELVSGPALVLASALALELALAPEWPSASALDSVSESESARVSIRRPV